MTIKIIGYAFLLCEILTAQFAVFGIVTFAQALPDNDLNDLADSPAVEAAPEEPALIISAVQITGGTGRTQEDFIELYNPGSEPFDLNGHRLVKRTAAGTADTAIKAWTEETLVLPHHFYLWANSGFAAIPAVPDAVSSATLADNNGIALRSGSNDIGEIIDNLAWGSTANGFDSVSEQNPGASESLLREDLFSVAASFVIQPSNPRNSTIELLPAEIPEVPEVPEGSPADEPVEEGEPAQEEEPEEIDIRITELMPNPAGSDSGFEQVELYNAGSQTVDVAGFKLDDVALTADSISSDAYILPPLEISPNSYKAVTIPSGKFALNNTGGDIVTLFDAAGAALNSVFYEGTAPEALSYSHFASGWQWAEPTLGQDNGAAPPPQEESETEDEVDYDNSGLIISELYPRPGKGETEFIEIYNSGDGKAQLKFVSAQVGDKKKVLLEHELAPGEYFVIDQSALPAQLRNTGQIVKLLEAEKVLDEVEYPKANGNHSYSKFEDGFLWTTKITKGTENILQLPEEIKKQASKQAVEATKTTKTTGKKAAKPAVSKAVPPSATPQTGLGNPAETATLPTQQEPTASKEPLGKIIAMGAAAVAAGVMALYKLAFTTSLE